MSFSRYALQRIRTRRQRYFEVDQNVPPRLLFRNTDRFFWQLLFLVVLFSFFYWRVTSGDRSISFVMAMFVLSIFMFGFTVKFLLSIVFPEVILDEEGIKLRGQRKIAWTEITSLKIDPTFDLYADIKLKNGSAVHHRLELSDGVKLRKYVRSFFRKYRRK